MNYALAAHQNTCRYESKIFVFAQDKFLRYANHLLSSKAQFPLLEC